MEGRSDAIRYGVDEARIPSQRFVVSGLTRARAVIQLLLGSFALLLPQTGFSEPPKELPTISIVHNVPNEASIPSPGSKLRVAAFLSGAKQFERPMRLLAIRDEKLLDIWLPSGRLDSDERPLYEFDLHAPEQRLKYRFVWYSADGKPVTSPEFALERSCKFPSQQVSPDEAIFKTDAISEGAETERLFHVSEGLNREIIAYQEATKLLGELRGKIDALQRARGTTENGG
jgi:hypothetical protein